MKQPDYFEGRIIYESLSEDEHGKLVPSKYIGKQEYFYKDTFYKFILHDREGRDGRNLTEIIVNTADSSRFSVHHRERTKTSLGMEAASEAYLPLEVNFIHAEDTLLGYPCKKYEMLQLDFYTQTKLRSYLWVAEDLAVKNLPLLGKIFGYRNTLIKDGSLEGIILKYQSEATASTKGLVIQATQIDPVELDFSEFAIPAMYFPK
ncbi:hypothetical protein WJR50_11265 [Catalinimonas sp. 4WD22]|uniref:hypothetical protein n=1 Tax=Catalinimonas locisalis TaxID=3133978 RepID=UPI0031016DC5